MSCYFRHLDEIFKEIDLEIIKENKNQKLEFIAKLKKELSLARREGKLDEN